MNPRTRRYALFFGGVVLLLLATVTTPAGMRFELALENTSVAGPATDDVPTFSDFTEREQRLLTAAIDGESHVSQAKATLPSPGPGGPFLGRLTIQDGDQFHTFTRRAFFEPTSPGGLAAVVFAVGGVGMAGIAIRRDIRN